MAKRSPALKRKLAKNKVRASVTKRKTKRAAAKRYTITGAGNVTAGHSGKAHNTGKRRRSVKNYLRKTKRIGVDKRRLVRSCLPNSF